MWPSWDRREPLWAPGKVKARGGVRNSLNHLGCGSDAAGMHRFRPRSTPYRVLAARAKTPGAGLVGRSLERWSPTPFASSIWTSRTRSTVGRAGGEGFHSGSIHPWSSALAIVGIVNAASRATTIKVHFMRGLLHSWCVMLTPQGGAACLLWPNAPIHGQSCQTPRLRP